MVTTTLWTTRVQPTRTGDNTYVVEIVAADAYAGTDKLTVTISVINIDEPGTLILSTATPSVGEKLTAVPQRP